MRSMSRGNAGLSPDKEEQPWISIWTESVSGLWSALKPCEGRTSMTLTGVSGGSQAIPVMPSTPIPLPTLRLSSRKRTRRRLLLDATEGQTRRRQHRAELP
jgi:hypothetical protein